MYSGLFIVLLPLIIGYLIPLNRKTFILSVNRLLSRMVYAILFFMGINLALQENLSANLLLVVKYSTVFFICIFCSNLLALLVLEYKFPWKNTCKPQVSPSQLYMVMESLKLCAVIIAGFLLGLSEWAWLQFASKASGIALILLLVLVGIQLRNNGMTLRQVLLNRHGTLIAIVVALSSLVGGALSAWILCLPLKTGLAMASAYGWYSLSGILLTDAYGPVIGSAAFFNDLARELCAIIFIPVIIRRSRSSALGLCGGTSMNFTLPILQRSGGPEIVPAAIVHGFLLSMLAPVLMALFS